MSSGIHCVDNAADREIGNYWEKQFCIMAARMGKCFTPHQWHKSESATAAQMVNGKWNIYTLPDVTIWSAPGEHHEIKHKNPTRGGCYGLEVYRFEALLDFGTVTRQKILYTIHDHDDAGGKEVKTNDPNHWVTSQVGSGLTYGNGSIRRGYSWVNGQKREVDIMYWPRSLFCGLMSIWKQYGLDFVSP